MQSESKYPCRVEVYRDISYSDGLQLQAEKLRELKTDPEREDVILFCEHRPVITLGRSGDGSCLLSSEAELQAEGIDFFKVPRGGDITYHGTGQWTVYPLLHLERFARDLHKYMRLLEAGVMQTLAAYGIEAGRREGLTGVWVGRDKLCAVGIAVSRWLSWHGFAFNVQPDLELFKKHIVPCGITASEGGVTSLSELTGQHYSMPELIEPILAGLFTVIPYYHSAIEYG